MNAVVGNVDEFHEPAEGRIFVQLGNVGYKACLEQTTSSYCYSICH